MTNSWYYVTGNQRNGPVSDDQLRQLAASRRLRPDDLVWKDGMADWVEAQRVVGLFGSTPPNVPPPFSRGGTTASRRQTSDTFSSRELPEKVRIAIRLLYINLALVIPAALVTMTTRRFSESMESLSPGQALAFTSLMMFFVFIVTWLFIFLIGWGYNWARITWLVVLILRTPFTLVSLLSQFNESPDTCLFGLAQTGLQIAAFVLLFQRESSDWFREMKRRRKNR